MDTIPDKWVIVKLSLKNSDEPIYKVFATFYGGYLDGDSWRMNSGIAKVEEDEHSFKFFGHSGSCYVCSKQPNAYGTGSYTQGVLNNMFIKVNESGVGTIELLEYDTDWLNLIK